MNEIYIDFLLAGVSRALSQSITAPLDRIKFLYQCQGEITKNGKLDKPFTGVIDCFRRTLSEEGKLSLWRGNSVTIVKCFASPFLNFTFKDTFKNMFPVSKTASFGTQFAANIAIGAAAGATSLLIMYPFDFARVRLACDWAGAQGTRQFTGMRDVYRKTLAQDGVRGIFRGLPISISGVVVYRGLYFGLYDVMKGLVGKEQNMVGQLSSQFVLGWMVTLTAGVLSYPFSTIRNRQMMTSCGGTKYPSAAHAFREIVLKEGVKALFAGVSINIARAFGGSFVLVAYDNLAKRVFGQ